LPTAYNSTTQSHGMIGLEQPADINKSTSTSKRGSRAEKGEEEQQNSSGEVHSTTVTQTPWTSDEPGLAPPSRMRKNDNEFKADSASSAIKRGTSQDTALKSTQESLRLPRPTPRSSPSRHKGQSAQPRRPKR